MFQLISDHQIVDYQTSINTTLRIHKNKIFLTHFFAIRWRCKYEMRRIHILLITSIFFSIISDLFIFDQYSNFYDPIIFVQKEAKKALNLGF